MTIEYKVCTKCGESKPTTTEFFYKDSRSGRAVGKCKVCIKSCYHSNCSIGRAVHHKWKAMMTRCHKAEHYSYRRYGGTGVSVCEEWHNYDVFQEWYNKNNIVGWEMDKDILGETTYSPENCVFVPHSMNMFFTFKSQPTIERRGKKCGVNVKIKGKTQHLVADTEEDVLEQFYLFKELYLEKLVWEMKEEHKRLCINYPNTPQISPKLLSILENFSTQEYLEKKHLGKENLI